MFFLWGSFHVCDMPVTGCEIGLYRGGGESADYMGWGRRGGLMDYLPSCRDQLAGSTALGRCSPTAPFPAIFSTRCARLDILKHLTLGSHLFDLIALEREYIYQ